MEKWSDDAFHFPSHEEQLQEDISINNAAHSVIAAYEVKHPEAAQSVFRQLDTQLSELVEQLRGAEHVQNPNAELYWTAREFLERRNSTSNPHFEDEDQ